MQAMVSSFLDMERMKPGSCDLFMTRLLQRLARLLMIPHVMLPLKYNLNVFVNNSFLKRVESRCSSKDSSLKDLQDLAGRIFSKGKIETESTSAEAESKKKQQSKELNSNANLSPLARFLLSRFV